MHYEKAAMWRIILISAALIPSVTPARGGEGDSFFIKQVAPVLARRCLRCHNGIDRKGDFSLQTSAELEDSGFVTPKDIDGSYLIDAITASDDTPPSMPKNGQPLADEEVAAIRKWIESGADWPAGFEIEEPAVDNLDWWSFQPLRRPDVPSFTEADDVRWVRSPVDAFVLATIKEQGLSHAKEADRRTLIRRITYDLTGLPPSPEEVQAFVDDDDPKSYEKLVDHLLESKHYGERWARHWLDVVKYADTCGYDKDKLRPNAWPYRDYVIRSFNEDKPYGRFVEEQIAGDVLFPNQPDSILGLGFLAAGPWDFIGHVEVPESKIDGKVARNLDRDEMVSNTLNTFCSVTIQCARCHNHKFDPFTQEHYYSLQAVFAAVDRAERPYDVDPAAESRRHELATKQNSVQTELDKLNEVIREEGGEKLSALDQQIAELTPKVSPVNKPTEFGYHSQIVNSADEAKWVEVDLAKVVDISRIVLRPCHDDYAGVGAGFGFPVRFRVSVSATEITEQNPGTVVEFTEVDFPNPHLTPVEISLSETSARYIRVTSTKLAERSNDYIFALAELQVFDAEGNNLAVGGAVSALDSIEAPARWRRTNLTDGLWTAPSDPLASQQLASAGRQRTDLLKPILTPERIARRRELTGQLDELGREVDSLPSNLMVYAVATQFKEQGNFKPTQGKPRIIHLLHRGNVQQLGKEVSPGTIPLSVDDSGKFKLSTDHTEGDRRAALAKWMTSREHPLTWRSIVNRVWLYHFGRALVDSPNDFGRMGQQPSHPQLLDWLATEFRDNAQSFKQLHRLIVTSSVYRQASTFNEANANIDVANKYLWRMNRRRLEAEEIRDSILSVSGRLDKTAGGPGFYLFALEKTEHSPHYEYHKFDPEDAKSHRRSVYRFIVRSQPDPYMTTLDCADSSQSTPRRDETLTSLQALSLLNNRFNLVMAGHFAERLKNERSSLPEQVDRAMLLATGRKATNDERERLADYAAKHGLANLTRILFNFSEFVYLD